MGDTNKVVLDIIESFGNRDIASCLKYISKTDRGIMEEEYGKQWYKHFYTNEHVEKYQPEITAMTGGFDDNFDILEQFDTQKEPQPDDAAGTHQSVSIEQRKENTKIQNFIDTLKEEKSKNSLKQIKFNEDQNDSHKDTKLNGVLKRIVVTQQFVLPDDSIHIIKKRICASLLTSSLISKKTPYLLPNRICLYLNIRNDKYKVIGFNFDDTSAWKHVDIFPHAQIGRYYTGSYLESMQELYRQHRLGIVHHSDKLLEDYVLEKGRPLQLRFFDIYHDLYHLANDQIFFKQANNMQRLINFYVSIYFPSISHEYVSQILDYLSNSQTDEGRYLIDQHRVIQNDVFLEKEPISVLETIRGDYDIYQKRKNEVFINQAIVKVPVLNVSGLETANDLFNIFDFVETSKKIPYISIQTKLTNYVKKEYRQISDQVKLLKVNWDKSKPYGLAFKVFIEEYNKFITIGINETGILEYKSQWREQDNMTVYKLKDTYIYIITFIKRLNKMINSHGGKPVTVPEYSQFRFALLNTMQVIPCDVDIGEFSNLNKLFFPYMNVIIQNKSKSLENTTNTTLRLIYKRISFYETSSRNRKEKFILELLRNYPENQITKIVSRKLSIPMVNVKKEIEIVKEKYPQWQKSQRRGKGIEQTKSMKMTGITVDIRPRDDGLIVRITGATKEGYMERITQYLATVLFIYEHHEQFQNKWEALTEFWKVVTKRNGAQAQTEIQSYKAINNIKQLADIDPKRFAFTPPQKGDRNYSRLCQNQFQPKPYLQDRVEELIQDGYQLDEKTQEYVYDYNGTQLRAVKMVNEDTKESYYLACHPKRNGKHVYLGFQDQQKHPDKMCLPCCLKLQQEISNKPEKKKRYKECLTEGQNTLSLDLNVSHIAYISQANHILHVGRFGFLPQYLDIYFNKQMGLTYFAKNEQVLVSTNGLFVLYGMPKYDSLMHIFAALQVTTKDNVTVRQVRQKITDFLKKDTDLKVFTHLMSGKIRKHFQTVDNYIAYIQEDVYDPDLLMELCSVPGLFHPKGLNLYVFYHIYTSKIDPETKTKIRIDSVRLECHTSLHKKGAPIIMMYRKHNQFFLISCIYKKKENKEIGIQKLFDNNTLRVHLTEFKAIGCKKIRLDEHYKYAAKSMAKYIRGSSLGEPVKQLINMYYKCVGFVTSKGFIVPAIESRSVIDLDIITEYPKKLKTFEEVKKAFAQFSRETGLHMNVAYIVPDEKGGTMSSVLLEYDMGKLHVRIVPTKIRKDLSQVKIHTSNIEIDRSIAYGKHYDDERIYQVTWESFIEETYQLLRYTFSYFAQKNKKIQTTLMQEVTKKMVTEKDTSQRLKVVHSICSDLLKAHFDLVDRKKIDLNDYAVQNRRAICGSAQANPAHCKNKKLLVIKEMFPKYLDRLTYEIIYDLLRRDEILGLHGKYLDQIVDYNVFEMKEVERIIGDNAYIHNDSAEPEDQDINKIDKDVFYTIINRDYETKHYKNFYIQQVNTESYAGFRAYANGFYYLKYPEEKLEYKNIGYTSPLQTKLAKIFRAKVILEMTSVGNGVFDGMVKMTGKKFNRDKYVRNLFLHPDSVGQLIPEWLILTIIYPDHPVFVYDRDYRIDYVIDAGKIYIDSLPTRLKQEDNSPFRDGIHFRVTKMVEGEGKMIEIMYPV